MIITNPTSKGHKLKNKVLLNVGVLIIANSNKLAKDEGGNII
jgi:hypothetical protein